MNRTGLLVAAAALCFIAVIAAYQLRVGELEARLSDVERVAEAARNEASSARSNPLPALPKSVDSSVSFEESIAPVASELSATQEQLQKALARIDELEEREDVPPTQELMRRFGQPSPRETPEAVAKHQSVILDRHSTEEERLQALRGLRGMPDKLDPYPADVARELKIWLDQTKDPSVRADIIRQLHRAELEELKDSIVYCLQNDTDEEVRDEAAETLEDVYDDPWVIQALEKARDHDASAKVRATAAHSLAEIAEDAAKRAKRGDPKDRD